MKSGLEKRLAILEGREASKPAGFKIRTLADLVTWGAMPEGTDPDMSEAPDELLRSIVAATGDR